MFQITSSVDVRQNHYLLANLSVIEVPTRFHFTLPFMRPVFHKDDLLPPGLLLFRIIKLILLIPIGQL